MSLTTEIETAMNAEKPRLAETFSRITRGAFQRMVAKHGPSLRGVSSDWAFARQFSGWVRPICAMEMDARGHHVVAYSIDEEKLAAEANEYAENVAAEFVAKLERKVADLENVTVRHLTDSGFIISGTRNGADVKIEQHQITNVSKLGRPYAQFPSRIYLNGRFISEKAYKKG